MITRLVVRSGRLLPRHCCLAHCLTPDFVSASPLQPRPSTIPSRNGSSPTECAPRHQPQERTSCTKVLISRANHHPCVKHRGRSEHRLSGCLTICGLCVHVDPLSEEKEAIFEDVLYALRLKYGNRALQLFASSGLLGLERKSKTCL